MTSIRRRALAVAAVAAVAVTAAPAPASATSSRIALHAIGVPNTQGTGGAYRYDTALVPRNAVVAVASLSRRKRTDTHLTVLGLRPHRAYGAHLHVNACGAAPTAAGPHYQQQPDPVQPSVDPAYANSHNEVWLDVHTDSHGNAYTHVVNRWRYRTAPRSLVLHAEHTHTEPGTAGTAGARIACLTLS